MQAEREQRPELGRELVADSALLLGHEIDHPTAGLLGLANPRRRVRLDEPEPDGALVKAGDPVTVTVRGRAGDSPLALAQPTQEPLDVAGRDARERPIPEVSGQASQLRLRVTEGPMLAARPLFVVRGVGAEGNTSRSGGAALRRRAPSWLAEGSAAAFVMPVART